MSRKTVYVVQTLENGAEGVYSNKKAAWGHAESLCPNPKTGSYRELCKDDRTTLSNDDMDEVEVVPLPYLAKFEPKTGESENE
jgi:hypothetical protein